MNSKLKRFLALFLALILALSVMTACGSDSSDTEETEDTTEAEETEAEAEEETEEEAEAETRTVTDACGNVVEVPADVSKIAVTPLPWSSVIYAIDGSSERLVAINPGAMTAYTDKFLSKLDANYATLDTTSIGSDFSINMEEMVSMGVEVVVIWDNQTDEAQQLADLGIAAIMVKNDTLEDLQNSITAIGQLLGKEERAQAFNDLYNESYEYLLSYADEVEAADKPTVLYLKKSDLTVQASDHFISEALELAGADNVAADLSSITMEEIIELDPDIILLSNFDSFTPEDLYNNNIEGQDWSTVSAVINHRVYKTPMGIYRWDAPGVETPLMMLWLAQLIQPEIFDEIDIEQETADFFEEYFDYILTDDDFAQIFAYEANADSE